MKVNSLNENGYFYTGRVHAISSKVTLRDLFVSHLAPLTNILSNQRLAYPKECVHCHAIKNKIKNYATDKVKKL